jgi:hypothetical protein
MPNPRRPGPRRLRILPRPAGGRSNDGGPSPRASRSGAGTSVGLWIVCLAALGLAPHAHAQHVEVTALGGVQYGGSTDVFGGTASFDAGPSYGGMVYYRVRDDGLFGVSYSREQSQLASTLVGPGGPVYGTLDVDIGVLHAGGELEIAPRKAVTPILGLSVGATHFTPRRSGPTEWFFSAALTGGFKYRINRHIGLRAHARLIATVIDDDSRITCVSSGGLTCAVAADLDGLVQGDLVGGVYVAF